MQRRTAGLSEAVSMDDMDISLKALSPSRRLLLEGLHFSEPILPLWRIRKVDRPTGRTFFKEFFHRVDHCIHGFCGDLHIFTGRSQGLTGFEGLHRGWCRRGIEAVRAVVNKRIPRVYDECLVWGMGWGGCYTTQPRILGFAA